MSDVDDALLFGAVAAIYHESRPPTPPETFAWLTGGHFRDVLDLAAGTGRFTEPLTQHRPWIPRIHAVEPDARMLAELQQRCPGVIAQAGQAEAIPLADTSVDAVFIADAWQWCDYDTACKEIARVLRPGGRFGVVWNHRDTTVPWVAGLDELLPKNPLRAVSPGVFAVQTGAPFAPPERYEQVSIWSITALTLLQSLGTYSSMLRLPGDEIARRMLAAQHYLEEVLDSPSVVDVPIRTVAYLTHLMEP